MAPRGILLTPNIYLLDNMCESSCGPFLGIRRNIPNNIPIATLAPTHPKGTTCTR